MQRWIHLGPPTPELPLARATLHHALQVPAAVGHSLVPAVADQSNSNFAWADTLKALVGQATPDGRRAGLRLADLTVLLLDETNTVRDQFSLIGLTLDEGYDRLEKALAPLDERAPYDLPDAPVAEGTRFSPNDHYAELAGWFANADAALQRVATERPNASPVRCWPHHFDIATLLAFDPDADPETHRTVGAGMTPGDGDIAEPYWYVTPWPYPDDPDLPPLEGGGHWNTEGWLGAVLPAAKTTAGKAREQAERVESFLASAIRACEGLLGA